MATLLALIACQAPPTITPRPSPKPNGPIEEIPPAPDDTSATDTGTQSGVSLFDDTLMHDVRLHLASDAANSLRNDPKSYVEAQLEMDGSSLMSIGLRLKGSSSMRTLRGKAAFKVDFDRYSPDGNYQGTSKLTLNNMVNDDTQLHECMAWKFFRATGQPANRCSYAWVSVETNGTTQDYGLYVILETWNGDWMEENFGDREGRIYEGGYPYYPESWSHADLNRREAQNFELEYGDDVANADVIAAAQVLATPENWDSNASTVIDLDRYALYHVSEIWVGHWDGYVFATNNFRLRASPDNRIQILPSGLDWTFQDWATWTSSRSALGAKCTQDPNCFERLRLAATQLCNTLDTDALLSEFDRLQDLITPYTTTDPRAEYQAAQLPRSQAAMRRWISERCTTVLGYF